MTYLVEFREALMEAARRERTSVEPGSRGHARRRTDPWPRSIEHGRAIRWPQSMHHGRAILASLVLGLASPAVGAVQVGAPLGPEPQLSGALHEPVAVAVPRIGAPRP